MWPNPQFGHSKCDQIHNAITDTKNNICNSLLLRHFKFWFFKNNKKQKQPCCSCFLICLFVTVAFLLFLLCFFFTAFQYWAFFVHPTLKIKPSTICLKVNNKDTRITLIILAWLPYSWLWERLSDIILVSLFSTVKRIFWSEN